MAKDTLPHAIALLECLSKRLNSIDHMFSPLSTEFHKLKGLVKENNATSEASHFFGSEHIITYFQCLLLAGMSMKGGVNIPIITAFKETDNTVNITWDSQVSDSFTFGKVDDHFVRFIQYYCAKILGRSGANPIPPCIITELKKIIAGNYELMIKTKRMIVPLLESKQKMFDFMSHPRHRETFFIVMACMDKAQINAMFIHIQQFFPKDLKFKNSRGHMVNVVSLFQRSTTDIAYTLEKIDMYFELYFTTNKPIIREITRSKTTEYLDKLLANSKAYEVLKENLQAILNSQIQPRMGLYQLILKHLSKIDLAKQSSHA